jgi:ribosomal protein L44E
MKRFFEESEWKRLNLTKWQFIHIDNVIVANSNLSLIERFQKLCIDLNDIQKELNSDYHDSNHMQEILIRACRNHSILLIELHNSSSNVSSLINSFYISIINFKSINKKRNTYLQNIDTNISECDHINCTHEHNFIDRQYRRESINYRDNRKFLTDSRFRDRFSIRFSTICFVCDKSNFWSINHSKKEREDSKKRFANRNSKWKSHSEF